jgi:transglutaminase-like putative cysteine protease
LTPDDFVIVPSIAWREYQDVFFNVCTRIVAPTGSIAVRTNFYIRDSGQPDAVMPSARQHPIEELPDDVLVFLLGSRYCETQKLADFAWRSFGGTKPGWERVQAICNFVHDHVNMSTLGMATRGTIEPRSIRFMNGSVYVAILPTWRLLCAAA